MAYDDNDNDGRFPDDSQVEVRYPRTRQEEHGDRAVWPWLPGSIVEQCGPDEWRVCVEDRDGAVLRDGRPAPRNTASRNLYYPMCFRDSSEIRRPAPTVPRPSMPAISMCSTWQFRKVLTLSGFESAMEAMPTPARCASARKARAAGPVRCATAGAVPGRP